MDSALKQRLLGAAVLIALAVIFVPMFLGNSPPKQDNVTQSLDIPPPPERKFETRTMPVDTAQPVVAPNSAAPDKASADAPAGDKIVSVDTKAPATYEVADTAAPPVKPTGAIVAKPPPGPIATVPQPVVVPVASPPPPVAQGRFTLNLGIYADQSHVDGLIAKVKKLGFAAFAESTDYQGKPAQRVRAGPFSDRAAAEEARLKIKQIEPKLPNSLSESNAQPTSDTLVTAMSANRAGGWAVQVGAFKSEGEANKVRDRLRNASIAAFVDRSGNGDQPLWRVRAGPYADRSGADSARGSIKQKLQLDGVIVTQP